MFKSGYDTIASFYDRLARLVFGNTLVHARLAHLGMVAPNSSVLMVGGGSGLEIEALTRLHSSGLKITYVDASQKMMAQAARKDHGSNEINFIVAPIQAVQLEQVYDVIITQFFFDNFSAEHMQQIFAQLHNSLKDRGLWLLADFTNDGTTMQRSLLRIMYLFFRTFCGVEAGRLPPTEATFKDYEYAVEKESRYLGSFVLSACYRKQEL